MVGSIVETSPAPGITSPAAAKTRLSNIFYREQGAAIQVGLPKTAQRPLVGVPKTIVDGADNEPQNQNSLESKIGGSAYAAGCPSPGMR